IVDTPTSGLSTITTPWTGTFTSTTISETVETDSNGSSFTTSVVVIDTPTSDLSTITTPWTGTFTTTYTAVTVATNGNGDLTTSTIVIIDTPTLSSSTQYFWNTSLITPSQTLSSGSELPPSQSTFTDLTTTEVIVTSCSSGCSKQPDITGSSTPNGTPSGPSISPVGPAVSQPLQQTTESTVTTKLSTTPSQSSGFQFSTYEGAAATNNELKWYSTVFSLFILGLAL
ncbi:DEKNAAC102160, partial [Brettanomyces naardenensis]